MRGGLRGSCPAILALAAAGCITLPAAAEARPAHGAGQPSHWADTLAVRRGPDSVYVLPPVVVRARRLEPAEALARLPGQASYVDLEPLRLRLATTAEVLERLPGLHVSNYGGLGSFSTVSIRGSGPSQVSVYLDGIPLGRAGLGILDLSELPFAGLDHLEVYRGGAPPDLPGASLGGAINLVSMPATLEERGGARRGGGRLPPGGILAGTGSYGTRRLGLSHRGCLAGWSGLVLADLLQTRGDFHFLDDNGTPLTPSDDEVVPRRNNWGRSAEALLKLERPFAGRGRICFTNQWLQRQRGVPGIPSSQAVEARSGVRHDLASLRIDLAPFPGDERLGLDARIFHDWRRDTFADPASEIGLGIQDNRDVTRALGAHLGLGACLRPRQRTALDLDVRREIFLPWRRFPGAERGPEQDRTAVELALEQRFLLLGDRLDLQAGWRAARERDRFAGDLRTPYSQRPAAPGTRTYGEPRLGARLRLGRGVHVEATYGRYHRTPGFLELFGDGGSVAGSSDLVAETGIDRDVGIEAEGERGGMHGRVGVAHFENHADHFITLLPQTQRTFVARNIGSARLRGEEWSGQLAAAGRPGLWTLDGSYTHLRTTDLGVDRSWYAGRSLPGRPEHQLFARLGLRRGGLEIGYEYEHLGRNYLDRANKQIVTRRDLHGLDVRGSWSRFDFDAGVRNLTGDRAADVAGFPLPGRTFSANTTCHF